MSRVPKGVKTLNDNALILGWLLLGPLIVFRGWLASIIWRLYFPGGLEVIGMAQFVGIALLIDLFPFKPYKQDKFAINNIVEAFISPLMTFGLAEVLSWFIVRTGP